MPEISQKHPSTDTLLAVMSEQLKNVLESVKKIETKLDSKADISDVLRLEKTLEEYKKDSDTKHEKASDKITAHTVRFGVLSGAIALAAWFIK